MERNLFHHPSESSGTGPDGDRVGAYGFGGRHGPGDEDAARRLRKDHMEAGRRHGRGGLH